MKGARGWVIAAVVAIVIAAAAYLLQPHEDGRTRDQVAGRVEPERLVQDHPGVREPGQVVEPRCPEGSHGT